VAKSSHRAPEAHRGQDKVVLLGRTADAPDLALLVPSVLGERRGLVADHLRVFRNVLASRARIKRQLEAKGRAQQVAPGSRKLNRASRFTPGNHQHRAAGRSSRRDTPKASANFIRCEPVPERDRVRLLMSNPWRPYSENLGR
jgi:hypothetical protein